MNSKVILLRVIVGGLIAFVLYIHSYQSLVNEGVALADEHCIKVNPHIKDRKNKYLVEYNIMMASSTGNFQEAVNQYNKSSEAYVKAEGQWLPKEREYLASPLFNLIMPTYIKQAGTYQYQMYLADYNSIRYLVQAFNETNPKKQVELSNKSTEETNKSKVAGDKFETLWATKNGGGWIYTFVKIPASQCPAENSNMPNMPVIDIH